MDNFYKAKLLKRKMFYAHTGAFIRRFSVLPALDAIGYMPEKREWIDAEFPTWNFSIILSGNGTYIAEGKEYPVISPCVLTQQPGIHTNYGSDSSWEELFFIYDKEAADTLIRGNVFPGKHKSPIWRFNDTGTTMASIRQLAEALDLLKYQQYAGNIDFLAYEIIISTINNPYREKVSRSVSDDFTKILTVEKSMRINPAKLIDIDQTSITNDMHPAKFRRLWNVLFKDPPIRHLQKLRLMQSAKLLAETKMQIQEIADITGFQDSLYFSRQFKREYGLSPKYYREKYTESLIMGLPE